ncbi:MAG: acylneuraminate cytidylyltransferase family protein [Anaerolineaceae bacterium]|nr:MAG: acylneuraminate cytidylyltransferase family protein [Anaerolineaceae bacterium]
MPRTVAIVQGRMGSSRLPGKVLLDIAGQPMLARVLSRARRARTVDLVAVATTIDPSDDPVAAWCAAHDTPVFRGDVFDVLDRYYQAARQFAAEIIVRLTADCPVIDPELINQTVSLLTVHHSLFTDHLNFSCNRLPPPWTRTFPIGLDVEVCTFAALERAWKEARGKHQREHVMPYLYEGVVFSGERHPLNTEHGTLYTEHCSLDTGLSAHGFRIAQLHHDPDYGSLRWTVDTPEDLELMRRVYAHFGRDDFSWQDVLSLQQNQPEMFAVNAAVVHKTAFDVDERQKPIRSTD